MTYAIASRDELWQAGVLVESRLTHGEAVQRGREIVATDAADPHLLARAGELLASLRDVASQLREARVRAVAEASTDGEMATLTVAMHGISIVTTPEHFAADVALLRAPANPRAIADPHAYPIVWRNGAAAVLFHEAAGHAAEHGHAPIAWPSWLRIVDVARGGDADLVAGEMPHARRRASFRDVPLARMTSVVASHVDAPFALPDARIEVRLVAGGSYEPLTEEVTLRIADADLVTRDGTTQLAPFVLHAPRARFAEVLAGATGEPLRYPGVICSREGQELVVHSYAPVIVTSELR